MAARLSLSKLRLSPRYAELAKFHASDGPPDKLSFELDDAAECDELIQICKHLDLECVFPPVPTTGSAKRAEIRRSEDLPEDEPEVVPQAPEPAPEALDRKGRPQKRSRAALEADSLLGAAPPNLAGFYRALVDSFPGHHVALAKSLVTHMRVAGWGTDSESSSESSSAKRRKKKRKKKKREKKKAKREKEEAEDEAKFSHLLVSTGEPAVAAPAAAADVDADDVDADDANSGVASDEPTVVVDHEAKAAQPDVVSDQPTVDAEQPAVSSND